MLKIGPVIECADRIVAKVERDMPSHTGILEAAKAVAQSAREAEEVSKKYKRAIGLHRLPAAFLALVLMAILTWGWWHFFRVATVTVAVSDSDAVDLGQQLHGRVQFAQIRTPGSRENIALVVSGQADAAFVQGGVSIPAELTRIELPSEELVLFFMRASVRSLSDIRTILTSSEGQGSHTVAKEFARIWQIDGSLRFVHDWGNLVADPNYRIAPDVDAVFVVKDPLDRKVATVPRRLQDAGFRLAAADIGIGALGLSYLTPLQLNAGDIDRVASIPAAPLSTYKVKTYLVARPNLNQRQLGVAHSLADPTLATQDFSSPFSSVSDTSELLQGLDSFLSILIYIGVAFIALAGMDIIVYRRRFHDLNALVSRVCMHHASSRANITNKADYVAYLRVCSDLVGIISVITGYYAQENSSLLYDKLVQIIPQRCDDLRITIELEIMHTSMDMQTGSMRPSSGAPHGTVA